MSSPADGDTALPDTPLQPDADTELDLADYAQRAYLASPERATVYEIDFADNARVSREFTPVIAPARFAETGR